MGWSGGESEEKTARTWRDKQKFWKKQGTEAQNNEEKGQKMKKSLQKIVRRTRGRGIAMNAAQQTSPQATQTIYGDLAIIDFNPDPAVAQWKKDSLGNLITDASQPIPDQPDALGGSAGNDIIDAGGGDDFLWGRAGDDRLYGGNGIDYLDGEAGDDRLYADTQVDIATAIAQGNAQAGSGAEGDWLNGGAGNDILVGSSANNFLTGGAGDDLIIAGAGDDVLLGDVDSVAVSFPGQTWHYDAALKDIVLDYRPLLQKPLPTTSGIDVLYAGAGNDVAFGGYGNDIIFGEADDDTLQGNSGNDVLLGGAGRDYLYGDIPENPATMPAPGDDYLDGGTEDDVIHGNEGNDILIGGTGNDILEGGAGQDTYIFSRGDGNDTVIDTMSDNNIFRFGAGISASDITLRLGSLMLDLGPSTGSGQVRDEIHIVGFDQTDVFNSSSIGGFEFEDGSTLSTTELLARGFDLDGTAGDDQIVGTNTTDRINGLAGDDLLSGMGGDDILNGGTGNDTQTGGDGSDTYLFSRGDGIDIIADAGESTTIDTLQFGADILRSDVTIIRLGNGDLSFSLNGSTDEVVVQGYYNNELNLIERVVFGDGSVMTTEDFAGIDSMSGGQGNDVLYDGMFQYGGEGDDVLYGGVYQYGGNGNDTLTYGQLLSGGAGDDMMDGDDYVTGRTTRYLIDPMQTGIDLIRDTGDSEYAYNSWYFGSIGIADWQERLDYGGQYAMPGWIFESYQDVQFDRAVVDWLLDSASTVDTFPDSYLYEWAGWAWPYAKEAVLADPAILRYIEPLPIFNRPAAYDYTALQAAYDAGVIPLDTVEFSVGITLADLQLSWGEITQVSPVSWLEEPYRTLVLSWNGGASQVQLVIPHADDPLGSGVEQIKFANGTIIGMPDLIAMAPPIASLDPRYTGLTLIGTEGADTLTGALANDTLIGLGGDDVVNGGGGNDVLNGGAGNDRYVFRLGDGADVIDDSLGFDTLYIGSDLTAADITMQQVGDDLVIGINNTPDSVTLTNWFIQAEGVRRIEFSDGSALSNFFNQASNTVPVAVSDLVAIGEDDVPAVIAAADLLSNDIDPDTGDTLSLVGFDAVTAQGNTVSQDANGNLVVDVGSGYQFLGAGQTVSDSFVYTIADAAGEMSSATVNVSITGSNDAPILAMPVADQATQQDATFSFAVPVAVFTDIDNGDVLTYSATLADGSALPAWLTFDAATQTFSGTPGNWDVGGYSVTVTATDTGGLTASSVFSVDVANVNDAPTVSMALAGQSILEDAPFSFTVPAGTFNDVDFIHGDTLTYGATLADGTALPDWLTFDAATQTFSGTPLNQDVGSLNVLVTATDTGGLSASSAFSLNVVNVNDTPTTNADMGAATEDGGAVLLDAATLLANDTDPDFIHGDMLNIVGVSQAASGAAVSLVNGAVQYDTGALFQSLGQGQTATDTFSYTVSDTAGATSTATVTMTVTGVNDAPVTADDAAAVQEDAALVATGNVLSNDTDVDQGTVLSITNAGTLQGNYGNLTLNADGSYSYALDNTSAAVQGLMAGQTVTETFAYQATDGIATTPATLTVTITGTNDAPVAQNDVAAVDEDSLLSIQSGTLLANDTDADIGDTRTLVGVDAVSAIGSSLSLVNGQVVYDHGGQFNSLMAGQSVLDSFSYTMLDSAGATSTATVNVTITGVNDGPQANGDSATMGEDTPQTTLTAASLLANDTDPDTGDALSLSGFDAVTALGNAVSMDAVGNLVFDIGDRYQSLAQGETLIDTFNYTITDTAGATSTAQVSMTIAGINDAPVAVADTASVQEDLSIVATGNVLANDSDVDHGTVLSVADAGTRSGNYGSLSLAADGSYTYTVDNASPVVQALGRDAQVVEHFGYTATDGIAGTAAVLDVFLNGANDAPILVAPLADQDFTFHKHFSWQVPNGSFIDIDQGDTLDYAATLADGSALPDWLNFDAATRTFSGETPKEVGFVDVRVTATDKVAATGSTAGSLSASDVFRISVSHGNEGVGNGEDAPPPGHDRNFNDGSGTSPGRPGAKGGKGYPDSAAHPDGNEPEDCSSDTKASRDDAHSQDSGDSDSRRTDELIRAWFEEESISEQYSSFGTLNQHGAWGGQIDRQVNRNVARGVSGDVSSEWERMNEQLKKHLEQSGGDEGIFAESGTGSRPFGLFGSGSHQGIPQLGMGNGQQMKALTGLNEGLERLG